ncbi:MAG: hypothetical protein ACRD0H_03160, partial [Actinomycetes bacterium]
MDGQRRAAGWQGRQLLHEPGERAPFSRLQGAVLAVGPPAEGRQRDGGGPGQSKGDLTASLPGRPAIGACAGATDDPDGRIG